MRRKTYNVYSRNESGEVVMVRKIIKMAPYHRRGLYKHRGSDPMSKKLGIFWQSPTGPSEGVAAYRFI